jgi:hypothetical protein
VHLPVEQQHPSRGRVALTTRDDGTIDDPQTPESWDAWVSAGRTRNFLKGDPLLDWLRRHGEAAGFVPDDQLPGYDPRTDFLAFIFEQGKRFEDGVMRLIAERFPVTRIAEGPEDSRSLACAGHHRAMQAGPRSSPRRSAQPRDARYGVADLLVRSDT